MGQVAPRDYPGIWKKGHLPYVLVVLVGEDGLDGEHGVVPEPRLERAGAVAGRGQGQGGMGSPRPEDQQAGDTGEELGVVDAGTGRIKSERESKMAFLDLLR